MKLDNACLPLAFAFIVFGTVSLSATEPEAVKTLSSGELAILNVKGIERVSISNARSSLVKDFGVFQAGEFAVVPSAGGDTFLVPLQMRIRADGLFARLSRYTSAGRQTAEWPLRVVGGLLGGITVDTRNQIAYCSDSRLNVVYKLELNNTHASFTTLVRIRDAGILGPVVLDARRGRLLIADVERGTILSVMLDSRKVEVVLDAGMMAEPVSMAIDPVNDRLYIADASRSRVWVGTPSGTKWKVTSMTVTQQLKQPISVALVPDGSLWVADRGRQKIWLFATADGKTLRTVTP
jgi:DNA-binding beta-propeller fold protein YncE